MSSQSSQKRARSSTREQEADAESSQHEKLLQEKLDQLLMDKRRHELTLLDAKLQEDADQWITAQEAECLAIEEDEKEREKKKKESDKRRKEFQEEVAKWRAGSKPKLKRINEEIKQIQDQKDALKKGEKKKGGKTRSSSRMTEEAENRTLTLQERKDILEREQIHHAKQLHRSMQAARINKTMTGHEDALISELDDEAEKDEQQQVANARRQEIKERIANTRAVSLPALLDVNLELEQINEELMSLQQQENENFLIVFREQAEQQSKKLAALKKKENTRRRSSLSKSNDSSSDGKKISDKDKRLSDLFQHKLEEEEAKLSLIHKNIIEHSAHLPFEEQYKLQLEKMPEGSTQFHDAIDNISADPSERWDLFEKISERQEEINAETRQALLSSISNSDNAKKRESLEKSLRDKEEVWTTVKKQRAHLEGQMKESESTQPAVLSVNFAELVRTARSSNSEESEGIDEDRPPTFTAKAKHEKESAAALAKHETEVATVDDEEEDDVLEDKPSEVANEGKAEERQRKEAGKVQESAYNLNPSQEKHLKDLMLSNPSLEDLKSDLIKFQKEEDLQPVEPTSSEGECGKPGPSTEKDKDKPDEENMFITMLRIGLVQIFKVDAQEAEWLLKLISKSMEKRGPNEQVLKPMPVSVVRKDNSQQPDLSLEHAIGIDDILQKEYVKSWRTCNEKLNLYTTMHNLPELKVVPDNDRLQDVAKKGQELLRNALDKCFSFLTGAEAKQKREESSNIFGNYASEMSSTQQQDSLKLKKKEAKSDEPAIVSANTAKRVKPGSPAHSGEADKESEGDNEASPPTFEPMAKNKVDEEETEEEKKVQKKLLPYLLSQAQEKKLHDVMLRNSSLEDLKRDLIKFQKEEDLQPVEPSRSEGDCGRPGKSNEKDGDKPDEENIFISMLRIGLVEILKVDAQTADWLLQKMSKSTEKGQVQKQPRISVQQNDNLVEPDLPLKHAIEIEKLVLDEYPKDKHVCQQLLDHYTFHNELPKLIVETDKDSAHEVPTTGQELLRNAIDKCLSLLSGVDARRLREKSSNLFRTYAEEMMTAQEQGTVAPSPGKSTSTSRDDIKNPDKQADPMGLLTIETSPVHTGPIPPAAVTDTSPSGAAAEVVVQPQSVLTNLVSPLCRQEPNITPSDTGVFIETHLPDFAELAEADVHRDLETLTDNVELQKLITLHAKALEDEGIIDLPTTGADEVLIYNDTVEVAFLQALKECYYGRRSTRTQEEYQSTVQKPFKKKLVQLFILAHQNKDFKITSTLKKEPAAATTSPQPDKVKVPEVVLKVTTTGKKAFPIPKRKSSPTKKSPVLKVDMKFKGRMSKIMLKKLKASEQLAKPSKETQAESDTPKHEEIPAESASKGEAESNTPNPECASEEKTKAENKQNRKEEKQKKKLKWMRGTTENQDKSLGRRRTSTFTQAPIQKYFKSATKQRADIHTTALVNENLIEQNPTPNSKQKLVQAQAQLATSLQLVEAISRPDFMSEDEDNIQFLDNGELRLEKLREFVAEKENKGVKVPAKKLKEVEAKAIKDVEKEIDKVRDLTDKLKLVTNALLISVLKESATLSDDKVATSFMEHFRLAFAMKPPHVFSRSQINLFRKTVRASIVGNVQTLNKPLLEEMKSKLLAAIKKVLLSEPVAAAGEANTTLDKTSTQPDPSSPGTTTAVVTPEGTVQPADKDTSQETATQAEHLSPGTKTADVTSKASPQTADEETSQETSSQPEHLPAALNTADVMPKDSVQPADKSTSQETSSGPKQSLAALKTDDVTPKDSSQIAEDETAEEIVTEPENLSSTPAAPEQSAEPADNETSAETSGDKTTSEAGNLSPHGDSEPSAGTAETRDVTTPDLENPIFEEISEPDIISIETMTIDGDESTFFDAVEEHTNEPEDNLSGVEDDTEHLEATPESNITHPDDIDLFEDHTEHLEATAESNDTHRVFLDLVDNKFNLGRSFNDRQLDELAHLILARKEKPVEEVMEHLLYYQEQQNIELNPSDLFVPLAGEGQSYKVQNLLKCYLK